MNFAQPPEEGPGDATRVSRQQATDPGRPVGRSCCQNAFPEHSLDLPLHPRSGWGIRGPQIKPALKTALSDAVVGSDKTGGGRTKAGDASAPPHFLTDRLELEDALASSGEPLCIPYLDPQEPRWALRHDHSCWRRGPTKPPSPPTSLQSPLQPGRPPSEVTLSPQRAAIPAHLPRYLTSNTLQPP